MTAKISTWLITGASSGIGKALALQALQAGHRVIGTSRDVSKAQKACPELSDRGVIWQQLDPGALDASEQFSKCVQDHPVDVLVNNAGYAFLGAVEDTSEDEIRQQMEVNFYGPLRTVKACLPAMRARGSGEIVLISSGAGFVARPSRSTYAASKFAIEAMHESLSREVSAFGIKVLIAELGAFRTPFCASIRTPAQYSSTGGVSSAYEDTVVREVLSATHNMVARPNAVRGDPDKAARAIVQAVTGGHEFLRMPLGSDCLDAWEKKLGELHGDLEATRAIAASTDVD